TEDSGHDGKEACRSPGGRTRSRAGLRRRLEGCEGGRKGSGWGNLAVLLERLRQAQKSRRDVNLRRHKILWTSAFVRTSTVMRRNRRPVRGRSCGADCGRYCAATARP